MAFSCPKCGTSLGTFFKPLKHLTKNGECPNCGRVVYQHGTEDYDDSTHTDDNFNFPKQYIYDYCARLPKKYRNSRDMDRDEIAQKWIESKAMGFEDDEAIKRGLIDVDY